jgi:DNA-binding LacI/PurR family transcriptional regulator
MSASPRLHRYKTIADEIRTEIARGAYGPDGRLPSERRLMRAFDAQRNTVRQALSLLEREGQIESVGKSGWFVVQNLPLPTPASLEGQRVLFVTFRRRTSELADHIAAGLRDAMAARGVQVLRYDSDAHEYEKHVADIQRLTTTDAGGLVMWPQLPIDASLLARLEATTPLVLVDRRVFGFESDSVLFDDFGGGRMATEHLLANGHRRIAFVGDEAFVESVQNRWQGYRHALEAAGVPTDDNLTVFVYGRIEPTFSANVRFLLRGTPEPPTGIVCSNDGVATKVLLVLREEGLRVPEDVAVTGFGNEAPGYLDVMGLTSVAQPFFELGRAAGTLLLQRLSEPLANRGQHPRSVVVPLSLVPRTSSGPTAT